MRARTLAIVAVLALWIAPLAGAQPYQMEALGRGVVAIRTGQGEVHVGWRLLGTDPADVSFHLYRSTNGAPAQRLTTAPLRDTTDFVDARAPAGQAQRYEVRAVVDGVEEPAAASFVLRADVPVRSYLSIPLEPPRGGTTPDGVAYQYDANDASVGDLDGDGEYEIVLKWDPTNSKDNSQRGFTGNVYLDAYRLDGTRMWRIDLGKNIRAGAHYTQHVVYDLDGDGRAEIAVKTADGTVDGTGRTLGDPRADFRNDEGYVLAGPELLTVFSGATGAAQGSAPYVPARGKVADWNDDYGNRVDRFLAGVAYLDGSTPSLIEARGYYTRTAIVAWDWRDGQLQERWHFDTRVSPALDRPAAGMADFEGQGNHQLSVGDIDGDGRQEVVYGAIAIDDDGRPMYTTKLGHGDALHLSDLDPERPGLEVYGPHETPELYGRFGSEMRDAATGEILWGASGESADVGRGLALDIDPRTPGHEAWASRGGLFSAKGEPIGDRKPPSINSGVWWDGDLLRELLDKTEITKWDWDTATVSSLLRCAECASNNGTKANPSLAADLLGDWREEVIWRSSDDSELRIYTTPIPAAQRLPTLMHDPTYRVGVATQQSGYNQPSHPGFFLGAGMRPPPAPNIRVAPRR